MCETRYINSRGQSCCKICRDNIRKVWLHDNRERTHKNHRRSILKQKYNLTEAAYLLLLESQSNNCAICGLKFSDRDTPYIDHCHKTNIVRGILCRKCNTGLGHFNDDLNLLNSAILYLS